MALIEQTSRSGSGNVIGPTPSGTDRAIATYDGITGKKLRDNPTTIVQEGGAVEGPAFIFNKLINTSIVVKSNEAMITDGFSIEGGELIIESDGEVVII